LADNLQASPRLRFNREGSLLAVTTSDNGIKILANTDGQRLLRMLESRAFEGSRGPPQQINTKVFYKNFSLNNIYFDSIHPSLFSGIFSVLLFYAENFVRFYNRTWSSATLRHKCFSVVLRLLLFFLV
jgi:hypothetical protein